MAVSNRETHNHRKSVTTGRILCQSELCHSRCNATALTFVLDTVSLLYTTKRGYLSGARCTLAYGPADATATQYVLLQ